MRVQRWSALGSRISLADVLQALDAHAGDLQRDAAAADLALQFAEKVPADNLPGFFSRYAQALQKRGLVGAQLDPDVLAAMEMGQPAVTPIEQGALADEAAGQALEAPAPEQSEQVVAEPPPEPSPVALSSTVDAAAHEAATSPTNDRAEPTQAQKEAGNYKVGRTRVAGLDIRIENPQGSKRRGVAPDGTPWETEMRAHYGYFAGTEGADGDKLDVFVKPGTAEDWRGPVFVIDQIDPKTGQLDEHKVVMGAADEAEAEALYRSNYDANWDGLGAITRLPLPAFKAWAKSGTLKEPLGDIASRPQLAPDRKPAPGPTAESQQAEPVAKPEAPVPTIAGKPVTELQIGQLLRYREMQSASERVRQVAADEVKRRETEFMWQLRGEGRDAQEQAILEQAREQQLEQAVAASNASEVDAPTTQPAGTAVRRDAQPAAGSRDTPAPAGKYRLRTIVGHEQQRQLGASVVLTPAQAAQATQYLFRSAVERFDALVTDKVGKPLAVVGSFKGAISQTSVYPGTVVAEAVRVPGAAHIWFSHNHPSGESTLSNADEFLNDKLSGVFKGTAIKPMGLLAVAGDNFQHQSVNGSITTGRVPEAEAGVRVPVIEREQIKAGEVAGTPLNSPTAARVVAKELYDQAGGPGLLMTDAQLSVSAWVPLQGPMLGQLMDTGGMDAVFRAISESNAASAFIVHGGELNPDQSLWEVNAVKRQRRLVDGPMGEHVVEFDEVNDSQRETVAVKDGGQTIFISVKDEELLKQLKNLHDEARLPVVVGALQWANRLLSRMYTSLNPVFTVLNGARDVTAGSINMVGVAGFSGAGRMLRNLPDAYREAFRAEVKGKPSALYSEYRTTGGKTGFMDFKDIEGYGKELAELAAESQKWGTVLATDGAWPKAVATWRRSRGAARKLLERIEDVNGAVENATRFAAYKAARQEGKSIAEAASIAKNITVNFNRKGSMTPVLSSFFLFFNPAVQGTTRMLQALSSREVQIAMGSAMAGLFGLALANASMGGDDDDDGATYWDKIPDEVKDRNLIIMLPPGSDSGEQVGKHGRYIKIPMPYGYNTFAVLAMTAADVLRNQASPTAGVSAAKGAARVLKSFVGSWVPVSDVSPSLDNPKGVAMAFVPDALDPVVETALNMNSFGRPMYPEGLGYDKQPDSEKVFAGQKGGWAHGAARWLNEATGGSQYHEGAVSVTPATINNLVRGYGGGVATFMLSIADMTAEQGVARESRDWYRAPFVRQLYGSVDMVQDQALAYDRLHDIEASAVPMERAIKAGDKRAAAAIAEDAGGIAKLGPVAKQARQQLTNIRKHEARVIESEKLTDAEKNVSLKQWDRERQKVYDRVNRAWARAIEADAAHQPE